MHSIVTYWQVKYKKRVGKSVLLETFLWSEKKVASHLCRRWIILREWRVGGRREGGKCFRWQGSISEPGRPRCYAPPGSCQSPRQSPITISVICNLRGLGNLQFEGTWKSSPNCFSDVLMCNPSIPPDFCGEMLFTQSRLVNWLLVLRNPLVRRGLHWPADECPLWLVRVTRVSDWVWPWPTVACSLWSLKPFWSSRPKAFVLEYYKSESKLLKRYQRLLKCRKKYSFQMEAL